MDSTLATAIVSSAGSVIVAIFGMFFTANQLGRRIDDTNQNLNRRIDEVNQTVREFRSEFHVFQDAVNGKLAAMQLKIAKLMERMAGS